MPAPQASYISRSATDKGGYDPATLSDDEDDARSDASRSTWASSSDATILGLVDGLIGEEGEREDWKVSRVGGVPSFPLSTPPPQDSSLCLSCRSPMPLLTQLYVPLPSSALERVVYLFACPNPTCRKKEGSVRAFRANALWVEGAEQERKEREEEERREREKKEREERAKKIDLGGMIFGGAAPPAAAGSNPFAAAGNPFAPPPSMAAAASSNPFAGPAVASNPFASSSPAPPPPSAPEPASTSLASASTSSWPSSSAPTPSFPPMYINTMYEPASSSPSYSGGALAKHLASVALTEPASDDPDLSDDETPSRHREGKGAGGRTKKGAKGGEGRKDGSGKTKSSSASSSSSSAGGGGGKESWAGEGYEVQKVKGVDEVFLRFQEVVAREGRQVVRYDFSTQPLPFSASSAAYRSLFPSTSQSSSSSSHPMATPAGTPVTAEGSIGTYSPSLIPPCRACGGKATFEYQLMPHLISTLSPYSAALAEAAGKKEGKEKEEYGVEFASVWVFTCEKECTGEGEMREGWREEGVTVEWEEE